MSGFVDVMRDQLRLTHFRQSRAQIAALLVAPTFRAACMSASGHLSTSRVISH
jgi:hypothetical protein